MNPSIDRAWALTHGDRREAYGEPHKVFTAYAKLWSGLLSSKLRTDITPNDVALMMVALKLTREAHSPADDNVVDAHGYLIMLDEVKCNQHRAPRSDPPPPPPPDKLKKGLG